MSTQPSRDLQHFPNPKPERDYEIRFDCPEFTCLCPATGQPDFASIQIQYNGPEISHEGLLRYLISYREHPEFAEQVSERIFVDILNRCSPERLIVSARYTRRGGIEINAHRTLDEQTPTEVRLWRQ